MTSPSTPAVSTLAPTLGSALPCRYCGDNKSLQWKRWAYELVWIHCDECGQESPPKPNPIEALAAWNEGQNAELKHAEGEAK